MADGTTGTAERTNSLQRILTTRVEFEFARQQIWGQFPNVPPEGAIGGVDAGQTVRIRFQPRLSPRTGTIDEKADIVPEQVTDQFVDVTINEYGHAVQNAEFSQLVTKGNQREEMAEVIGENMVASLDRLAGRQYYEGNELVYRANSVAARTDLDATADTLTDTAVGMSFLAQATAVLRGSRAPGFRSGAGGLENYATVVHTALAQDLPETAGYLPALQNRTGEDTLFNGEMGDIRGLRFMESPQGKVYLGAGTTAQGATDLDGAVTAGDTTITVTSASNLVAGDIITIGALEDGAGTIDVESGSAAQNENVRILSVAGAVLTVAGMGYSSSGVATSGIKFDHPDADPVTEAALVAAIPIFGPKSVMKAFAAEQGEFGETVVSGPFDVLQRFVNIGWKSTVGWAKTRGLWTVRMEVATLFPHIAVNE